MESGRRRSPENCPKSNHKSGFRNAEFNAEHEKVDLSEEYVANDGSKNCESRKTMEVDVGEDECEEISVTVNNSFVDKSIDIAESNSYQINNTVDALHELHNGPELQHNESLDDMEALSESSTESQTEVDEHKIHKVEGATTSADIDDRDAIDVATADEDVAVDEEVTVNENVTADEDTTIYATHTENEGTEGYSPGSKPNKNDVSLGIRLPQARIKRIVKTDPDYHMATAEAVYLLTKAAVEIISAAEGRCNARLLVSTHHVNVGNVMHGGMAASLVDCISTMALLTLDQSKPGVSVDLSLSFLKSAPLGREITISAETLKSGRSLAFLDVKITDSASGKLLISGKQTKSVGHAM